MLLERTDFLRWTLCQPKIGGVDVVNFEKRSFQFLARVGAHLPRVSLNRRHKATLSLAINNCLFRV